MKALPVGIQFFESLVKDNLLYVDKTQRIYEMISNHSSSQYFLSRPRRFGKTLLCWTLHELFCGKRELFDGLAISKTDWKWESFPVIHLDMSVGEFDKGLAGGRSAINIKLAENADNLGVALRGRTVTDKFVSLISDSVKKYEKKAVVIIDEYDTPLLRVIKNEKRFNDNRDMLRDFYGVIKASESKIRFAFLTGITKFAKVSIFSALNNLVELTLEPQFSDICGVTQEELERDLGEYVDRYASNYGGKESYLQRLKHYYNGYRFSKRELSVYNPFGLMKHFYSGEFSTYWFESGTPKYLMDLLDEQMVDILTFKDKKVTEANFRKYDLENIQAVPMLYQAGYLTIVDYDSEQGIYTLDYPNTEVRAAFSDELAEKYLKIPGDIKDSLLVNLPKYLFSGDITSAMNLALKPFMAEIPNTLTIRREKYFQTIFHVVFNMLGLRCRSEVATMVGRIDSIVETPKFVYCFEFKLDGGTAQSALKQIDTKEYLTPYIGTGKTLFKVGVKFDYKTRKIENWVFEKVDY
ncbi:hypothetical protein R80B4_01156 [Fibrobacteres bacterium R8-0-B4]